MRVPSAVLKQEIEAKLAARIPAALSPMVQPTLRLLPLGHERMDALLGGGLPSGAISEISGPASSGRTSIALSLLASVSRENACAYIDVSDSLSPHDAAAAGVQLSNLLWVRLAACAGQPASSGLRRRDTPHAAVAAPRRRESVQQNCGGPHPRTEANGLAPALEQVLSYKQAQREEKMEGTPGYANQPVGLGLVTRDQVEWERFNSRKVDQSDPLRRLDQEAAAAARQRARKLNLPSPPRANARPWDRLERAIRAADQVLQSGGFRVVVLDLASVVAEQALRIPSATWFRFRRAAQESDAVLLLLTQVPCARSSASCVLECSADALPEAKGVLADTKLSISIQRQRATHPTGKKTPGRVTEWSASPAWMHSVGS